MDIDTLLDPSYLIPIAGGIVVLLGIVFAVIKMAMSRKNKDMIPRWARGAYGLWTGGDDSATWARDRAVNSLKSWYGATNVGAFRGVIDDLKSGTTGVPAWDLVRALDLLRIGVAAGYIDQEECWTESARICRTIQQTHTSWEHLGQVFQTGMNSWQHRSGITDPNETGRVQRNLPRLRAEVWPQAPWAAKLETDD